MSDEKPKPFADVESSQPAVHGVRVGARYVGHWLEDRRFAEEAADYLNRAVEAREAKLRGALKALEDAAGHASVRLHDIASTAPRGWPQCECREKSDWAREADAQLVPHLLDAGAALNGTGPDYVPTHEAAAFAMKAAELELMNELLVDAQEALLSERERDLLVPFLRARGHAEKGVEWWTEIVTDEQLEAECQKRGMGVYRRGTVGQPLRPSDAVGARLGPHPWDMRAFARGEATFSSAHQTGAAVDVPPRPTPRDPNEQAVDLDGRPRFPGLPHFGSTMLPVRDTHIFEDDYAISAPGNQVRITGRAVCGEALAYGGDWEAVTQATFHSHAHQSRHCAACVAEMGRRSASPAPAAD